MKKATLFLAIVCILTALALLKACQSESLSEAGVKQSKTLIKDLRSLNDELITLKLIRVGETPGSRGNNPPITTREEEIFETAKSWGWKDVEGALAGWRIGRKAGMLAGPQSAGIVGGTFALAGAAIASATAYTKYSITPKELETLPLEDAVKERMLSEFSIDIFNPTTLYQYEVASFHGYDGSYLVEVEGIIGDWAVESILLEAEGTVERMVPGSEIAWGVGVEHNNVLEAVLEGQLSEMNMDPIAEQLFTDEKSLADWREFIVDLINERDYEYDDSGIVQEIFSTFGELYFDYPTTVEDIDYIISRYLELVDISDELNEEEKLRTYSAFSVASQSPRLWINYVED